MKITDSFEYNGTKQNFKRDSYATLADMKAVADNKMPSVFHAMCEADGKLYVYNKANEVDSTLGKWREVSGGAEVEEETDTIDFSTWPEFDPDLEAGGITLDGQGGANIDGSNVGVDPDDIEPDEP